MAERGDVIKIEEADESRMDSVWPILQAAIAGSDVFAYPPATTFEEAKKLWFGERYRVFTASVAGRVLGTYHLQPNQIGLDSHVANVGYAVDPVQNGRGIASTMLEHSLGIARAAGFRAMQFNYVVSTNEKAVRLWKRHGFEMVRRVP